MTGHGTMTYNNAHGIKDKYSGDWKEGLFHGFGELRFTDSSEMDHYKGNFALGLFHGEGFLKYRDGGYYEGEFIANNRHGEGKRVWASGNSFKGEWKNNQMVEGRYFNKFHQSNYVGTFQHDKKCGCGRETWRSPTGKKFKDPCLEWKHEYDAVVKYAGSYLNGRFHGKGTFEAPDGRRYDGEWKFGKPHGFGTMVLLRTFEFGDPKRLQIGKYGSLYRPAKYAGQWKEGKKHGSGQLTFADGSTKEVTYNDGVIVQHDLGC